MTQCYAQPLVSIVVPCYNHEAYVESSIRSVINQDYENIELIVLDDGSKDGSCDVIRSLEQECRDRFVRYQFVSKENEGVSTTVNRSLEWSRGDYFSSISSDDEMMPNKISTLMQLLHEAPNDVGMACGDAWFMDKDGGDVALSDTGSVVPAGEGYETFISFYVRRRKDVIPEENFFSYETLIKGNYIPGMSMLWRKNVLCEVGSFTPEVAIEDWDMWLRLAKKYRCAFTSEVMARYRVHGTNTSVVALNRMRLGMDFILEREFEYVRSERRKLAPGVARMWLGNSRKLYKAGYRRYLGRFFQPHIVLAALGLVLTGKS